MEQLQKLSEMSLEALLRLRNSCYAGPRLEAAIDAAIESGRRSDAVPIEAYISRAR